MIISSSRDNGLLSIGIRPSSMSQQHRTIDLYFYIFLYYPFGKFKTINNSNNLKAAPINGRPCWLGTTVFVKQVEFSVRHFWICLLLELTAITKSIFGQHEQKKNVARSQPFGRMDGCNPGSVPFAVIPFDINLHKMGNNLICLNCNCCSYGL